jgi:predicted GIY-YIG superfamily endonuclease
MTATTTPAAPVALGTVYLLHFDRPGPGRSRHYLGWTTDLDARLARHRAGRGAKLTRALRRRGVGWMCVLELEDLPRDVERRLHRRHNHARLCPLCRADALARHAAEERRRRSRTLTPIGGT